MGNSQRDHGDGRKPLGPNAERKRRKLRVSSDGSDFFDHDEMARDAQEETEYEKNRLTNIKRNHSILQVRRGPSCATMFWAMISSLPPLAHFHPQSDGAIGFYCLPQNHRHAANHPFIALLSTRLCRALAYVRHFQKRRTMTLAQMGRPEARSGLAAREAKKGQAQLRAGPQKRAYASSRASSTSKSWQTIATQ